MNDKIIIADSIKGAAQALRNMAELTAKNTQNWDNFELICFQVLNEVNQKKEKQ